MNTIRGVVPVLLILLIATIAGGAYYFKASSKKEVQDVELNGNAEVPANPEGVQLPVLKKTNTLDVNNWEIHVDDVVGYEIRYPAGWRNAVNNAIVNPARPGKPETDVPMEQLSVKIVPADSYADLCGRSGNFEVDGRLLSDTGWERGFGLIYWRTLCYKERSMIISTSVFDDENGNIDQDSKAVFESILASFKFREQKPEYEVHGLQLLYTPQTYKIGDTLTLKYKLGSLYKEHDVLVDLRGANGVSYGYGNRKASAGVTQQTDSEISFVLDGDSSENETLKKGVYDLCIWISVRGSIEDCEYKAVTIE